MSTFATVDYWWRGRANDGLFDGPWMRATTVDVDIVLLMGDFNGDLVVG